MFSGPYDTFSLWKKERLRITGCQMEISSIFVRNLLLIEHFTSDPR